jgi:hypothetical protein
MNTKYNSLKLMEKAHYGQLDIDGVIILKYILHKQRVGLYNKFL